MKKVLIITLVLFMIFTVSCTKKESKPTYNYTPYTSETAIKNGDVVDVHGKRYNSEKLDVFIQNVEKGTKDKVRITSYTVEGGAIIIDLEYDGKEISYTYDNTRDGFGVPRIDKKKFKSSNIYKNGSKYYLKESPEDILIY